MIDVLRKNWDNLLRAWSVSQPVADSAFDDIAVRYGEQGRFYHNLGHIQNVLETVESLASHAQNQNVVKLAVWLHDVVYDSKAPDNEERSAEYAKRLCETMSIHERSAVAALILKTKTHDAGADRDAQVLIDADLAVLGTATQVYRCYCEQIRQEYAWVSDADYRQGRRQVLQNFLRRSRIFNLLGALEAPARQNMTEEIARLSDEN